jgi:hypothetical protein
MARGGRVKGSKNRRTLQRERAKNMAAALSETLPPIDFAASFDSLEMMEGVMRHFYIRALFEQRQDSEADWDKVDNLMLRVLTAAEKVARYRHAQLSAIKLSGDPNPKVDPSTVEELIAKIREEYKKLGPLIDLDVLRRPQQPPIKGGVTVAGTIDHGWRSRA